MLHSASIFVTVLLLFQKQSSRPGKGPEGQRQDDQSDGIASTQGNVENLGKGTHGHLEPGNPLLTFLYTLLVLLSIKQMYFLWYWSVLPQEVIGASLGMLFLSWLDFIVSYSQPPSVWGRI